MVDPACTLKAGNIWSVSCPVHFLFHSCVHIDSEQKYIHWFKVKFLAYKPYLHRFTHTSIVKSFQENIQLGSVRAFWGQPSILLHCWRKIMWCSRGWMFPSNSVRYNGKYLLYILFLCKYMSETSVIELTNCLLCLYTTFLPAQLAFKSWNINEKKPILFI